MRLLDLFIRLLKPFDYLLFAALIVGSFSAILFFSAQAAENTGDRYAIVRLNGQGGWPIQSRTNWIADKTYAPTTENNISIRISNGKIRVKEDNSPDQDCCWKTAGSLKMDKPVFVYLIN